MIEDTLGTYPAASSYTRLATHDSLVLQTATGLTPHGLVTHPLFFSGNVTRPDVAAAGLRALVEVEAGEIRRIDGFVYADLLPRRVKKKGSDAFSAEPAKCV